MTLWCHYRMYFLGAEPMLLQTGLASSVFDGPSRPHLSTFAVSESTVPQVPPLQHHVPHSCAYLLSSVPEEAYCPNFIFSPLNASSQPLGQ